MKLNMSKRILLIEDEQMIREMYEIALKEAGYKVNCVKDGKEALEILKQPNVNYDLVLLDILLPELNGMSVLNEMKKNDSPSKNIPVILLTNLGMEGLVNEAMNLGAEQYLIKSNILPQNLVEELKNFFTAR